MTLQLLGRLRPSPPLAEPDVGVRSTDTHGLSFTGCSDFTTM